MSSAGTIAPGVWVERRSRPRLAPVKVRGGLPTAAAAFGVYCLASYCAGFAAAALPLPEGLSRAHLASALTLVFFAGLLSSVLRSDAVLEGDLGYRPWTIRETLLGGCAGLAVWLLCSPLARVSAPFHLMGSAFAQETLFRGFLIGAMRARFGRGPWKTALFVALSAAAFSWTQGAGEPGLYLSFSVSGLLYGLFFLASRSLNFVMAARAVQCGLAASGLL